MRKLVLTMFALLSMKFPPFLRIIEDVTGNQQYYNYNIALRK